MPETQSDDETFLTLGAATAGLLYPSESDEPFSAFVWKATEPDALRQIAALGKPIEPLTETSADDFFAELVAGEDGEKFRRLRAALELRLSALRVLRIGEIEVNVYLIGKTAAGNWAGVQVLSVET